MSLLAIIAVIPLCVIPPAVIVYFFLSKKSDPPVKRAALIALILLVLSLGVSALFILDRPQGEPGFAAGDIPVEPLEPPATDFRMILTITLVVLFFIALIVYMAWRDARRGRKNFRDGNMGRP
jgi:formate hydrogenlyase subunit 3/multisubunit Na+/H+ antiporter MnhD subunit